MEQRGRQQKQISKEPCPQIWPRSNSPWRTAKMEFLRARTKMYLVSNWFTALLGPKWCFTIFYTPENYLVLIEPMHLHWEERGPGSAWTDPAEIVFSLPGTGMAVIKTLPDAIILPPSLFTAIQTVLQKPCRSSQPLVPVCGAGI